MKHKRRQSTYREDLFLERFEDDDLHVIPVDRNVISPWVRRKSSGESISIKPTSRENENDQRYFQKLKSPMRKHFYYKTDGRSDVSDSPHLQNRDLHHQSSYKKKNVMNQTTFIAIPNNMSKGSACSKELAKQFGRKRTPTKQTMRMKMISLDQIQDNKFEPLMKTQNVSFAEKQYNLTLFQMKWRSKENKKQKVKKRLQAEHQESTSFNSCIQKLFERTIKYNQLNPQMRSNRAKTLRLNRQSFLKTNEKLEKLDPIKDRKIALKLNSTDRS